MSIQLSNITKKIGNQLVLNNLSFSINPGEIVGFLGPNGAGKTTTMRIITGVMDYDAGSVRVDGMEVRNNKIACNALIGYLPENNPLYTDMYVREYLLHIADIHQLGKNKTSRINELIEMVGLSPESNKRIGQLSKGYRQRVGLAQALIPNPKVLILDEPTTGLDPNQLEDIRALISEIGKEKTVLLSTHIMQEINALCSRVIIINKGSIVADYRDVADIYAERENNQIFTVEFSKPVETEQLLSINEIKTASYKSDKFIEIVATADVRAKLFHFAVETGNVILTLRKEEHSVEEIFKSLTSK